MRISRIFLPAHFEEGHLLEVEGESCHYLKNVLRLRKGWRLIIFDGRGLECPAVLESFGRDVAFLRLGTPLALSRESSLDIHLALGISRGEKMDFAIQKAVELGVSKITPLMMENCVVRLDEEKKDARRQHWKRVIQSACEQSGRNTIPEIDAPLAVEDWWFDQPSTRLRLILDPEGKSHLKNIPEPAACVTLVTGPEGGFSERERDAAHQTGFTSIMLGPRVMRAETAVISALTSIQVLWGDLG